MAPKKGAKAEAPPAEAEPEPGPPDEVEEEGPETVTFTVDVKCVSFLPKEFETKICVLGLCKEFRSQPAAASASPSGWTWDKTTFVRTRGQGLYDDLVRNQLVVVVKNAVSFDVIGTVRIDLSQLLHDRTQVEDEMTLVLTDKYRGKWLQDGDAGTTPEPPPTPPPVEDVPRSSIKIAVSASDLVGPAADRDSWTTLAFNVGGVFGLPNRLTALGLSGADDVENHQMTYTGTMLGEPLGQGLLTKPAEAQRPDSPASTGEPEAPTTDCDPQEQAERFGLSVRFAQAERVVLYRGSDFIQEWRKMLNDVGGICFEFVVTEKPSTDPKKPNPPELGLLSKHFSGKAWFDVSSLIRPGTRSTGIVRCPLRSTAAAAPEMAQEPTLDNSGAFVLLTMELSHDTAPPQPPEKKVPLPELLPSRPPAVKFPPSSGAVEAYKDAITRSFEKTVEVTTENVGRLGGGASVQASIDLLKRAGCYEEVKRDIRSAVVQICRERLRKDIKIVPGKPLEAGARGEFMASTYSYLQGTMSDVLNELRASVPQSVPPLAAQALAERALSPAMSDGHLATRTSGLKHLDVEDNVAGRVHSFSSPGRRSTSNSKTPVGATTPVGTDAGGFAAEPLVNPVAAALAESANQRRAREALGVITDPGDRCKRLALEAEMVGHWDRAASLTQSRLVLPAFKDEPVAWLDYAKLCARARGRQAAAEEALRQVVQLLAHGPKSHTAETALEVDLMLASLLLDRGRHDEAIKVFRAWHEKDFQEPQYRFFLGLGLFLAGENEEASLMLESSGKSKDWFAGLPDSQAVVDKLRAFRKADGPPDPKVYASCLEKLLDFGLPQLVFTFVDQSGTLSEEAIATEPIALLDATASAMERDYGAAATRVERLIQAGTASREAWRLAGDCYYHLQDYDNALKALQQALTFEPSFEDPGVYVRLGHVLLLKKRWRQARDAFLKSIHYQATAEAWSGVAYAEFRSEDLHSCYEAICEANLLDNERPDVWAQLALVQLRFENWENANFCTRQCLAHNPDFDELLLELSQEYSRHDAQPWLAESCARRALEVRESGHAHAALADALAISGDLEKAVLEAQVGIRLLVDNPEQRRAIFERAHKWCDELSDPPLAESLHAAQRSADQQYAERAAARDEHSA